jgi:hypothetical protein
MLVAFTIAAVINLVVRQILLKRLIHFDIKEFILKAYFKMLLVVIPLFSFFSLKYFFNEGLARFICSTILSIFFLFFLIYKLGMEKSEKELINDKLTQSNMFKKYFTIKKANI